MSGRAQNEALLFAALREPASVPEWPLRDWEILVRQARDASLLGRLAALLYDLGLTERVPEAPRAHLEAARIVAEAQEEAVRREVAYVRDALASLGLDVVLLKGSAYVLAGLPAARGRLMSDIDILVPVESLPRVEAALLQHGWAGTHHDPYDQRYYREWMHELPPLRHVRRQTVLDVHHAIAPLTARLRPDSRKLLASAVPLENAIGVRVLSPSDMVLHSAAHLFLNEELSQGLRDLVDIDALLRHFAARPGFWADLVARGRELDLEPLLAYALRYSARLLGTPVPAEAAAGSGFPAWRWKLMDALYTRVLAPQVAPQAIPFASIARRLLYLRGHWLRLPPHLLAYHLTVKAFRRHEEQAPRPR